MGFDDLIKRLNVLKWILQLAIKMNAIEGEQAHFEQCCNRGSGRDTLCIFLFYFLILAYKFELKDIYIYIYIYISPSGVWY